MKRRTVLSGVAASVATGLAGCLDTGPAPGGDDEPSESDGDDGSGDGGSGTDDSSGDGGSTGDDGSDDGTDSGGSDDGTDSGDDSGGDDSDDSATTTTAATPSVEDTSLSVGSASCGTGENAASIAVEATADSTESPAGIVTVTGTIRGSDQCHTARLKAASYDESTDTLTVAVVSYVPDDKSDSVCGQCIVDIEYESTVEVGGAVPGTIAVTHGGEEVAKKSPGAN